MPAAATSGLLPPGGAPKLRRHFNGYCSSAGSLQELAMFRLGIIGAGGFAERRILPALQDEAAQVCVSGIQRRSEERLESLKERFGVSYASTSIDSLLESGEVDGVWITSPNSLHFEHARAALQHRIPTVVEKPFTNDYEQAEELLALSRQMDTPLAAAFCCRMSPAIQRLRELLPTLGAIEYVQSTLTVDLRHLLEEPNDFRPWMFEKNAQAVGALSDLGSHVLDIFVFLFGNDWEIDSVQVNRSKYNFDDSACLTLKCSSADIAANVFVSYVATNCSNISLVGENGSAALFAPYAKDVPQVIRIDCGGDIFEEEFLQYNILLSLAEEFAKFSQTARSKNLACGQDLLSVQKLLETAENLALQ